MYYKSQINVHRVFEIFSTCINCSMCSKKVDMYFFKVKRKTDKEIWKREKHRGIVPKLKKMIEGFMNPSIDASKNHKTSN